MEERLPQFAHRLAFYIDVEFPVLCDQSVQQHYKLVLCLPLLHISPLNASVSYQATNNCPMREIY